MSCVVRDRRVCVVLWIWECVMSSSCGVCVQYVRLIMTIWRISTRNTPTTTPPTDDHAVGAWVSGCPGASRAQGTRDVHVSDHPSHRAWRARREARAQASSSSSSSSYAVACSPRSRGTARPRWAGVVLGKPGEAKRDG